MPVATITVKYVNQPREGKKYGSIKDDTGTTYSVKPSDLGQFQPGGRYEIEYAFDNSGKWRNFVKLAAPPVPPADKERSIFVTGVVGRAMGSGKFELADIDSLTMAADAAWEHLMASQAPQPTPDEEIPF